MPEKGKLLEFSKNNEGFFGLVEFKKNIRIMGKINSKGNTLKVGQPVKFEKDTQNNEKFSFVICPE